MNPYIGIVDHVPGSAYGISFPDAPGCFSAVDEMADIFAMAQEALAAWTEAMVDAGHVLPSTRDLATLRADSALSDDFAEAAFIIAVPAPGVASQLRAAE